MKITDIQIDRYGVWRHLALPLPSAGLNVFYGPNEAGKTTLLRFIQDVFHPRDRRADTWSGSLRIAHGERFSEVRRTTDAFGGRLEFQELNPALAWNTVPDWAVGEPLRTGTPPLQGEAAEDALAEVLAQTSARLFRHVFAIGLNELQEVATLHDEEIAKQIFGLSLGWDGRRLLEISQEYGDQIEPAEFAPEIALEIETLIQRDLELQCELELYAGLRDRHEYLTRERDELSSKVSGALSRRAELKEQLRGHEAIQQIWDPWNEVRECEMELESLPAGFDTSGLGPARLDELEQEIRRLSRERKSLIAELKRLRAEWKSARHNSSPNQFAVQVEAFLSQREWLGELESELELCAARARELKTEFEARHQALGPEWPIHRLIKSDTSRAAYSSLVDAAQAFQSAQTRLGSLRKRYEKSAALCHQEQSELDQAIASLPEQSLEDALESTRSQIVQAEELVRLKSREGELASRIKSEESQRSVWEESSPIPSWTPGFLMFLAASGMILSALGFYTGLTSNGITGAILCLVGVAGFAIARGFQLQTTRHWETSTESASLTQAEELSELRSAIKENTPAAWVVPVSGGESNLSEKLKERFKELKKIRSQKRRQKSRRRRLSRMRKVLQNRQRDVAHARDAWCETLKNSGLDETMPVEDAFEIWQRITETKEHKRAYEAARAAAEDVQNRHQAFCQKLADIGRSEGFDQLDYNQPLQVLDVWEAEALNFATEPERSFSIKQEYRNARRQADRLKKQIFKVRAARLAFLAKAGATSRKEFESRLDSARRRGELKELLELAQAELAEISAEYRDLAIVEDDLVKYDAAANQDTIDLIQLELEELETEAGDTPDRLEQIELKLGEVESERRPAAIRWERESITSQLKECLQQQAAITLAATTAREIREQFEKSCQPELLNVASEYLAQLTSGKYQKIWTTLGEQSLRITDAEAQPFTTEQLSSGTREQLFLALRLGLVQEYAKRGTRLPLVLDDVLVNFDQYRTEAAIKTLIEFADRGHQVLLFTSHVHVARISEQEGIDPIWLPAHQQAIEHRRAG